MGKLMYQGENLTGAPPLLGSLKDVNITSPSNNDALVYNSTTQKWENGAGGGGSLDIVPKTQAEYNALTPEQKADPTKVYDITDANLVNADIDDTTTSVGKVWSSSKISSEIQGAGLIHKTQEEYDALPSADKSDPTKHYLITNTTLSGAPLDDTAISNGKVWSSDKVNNELTDIQDDLSTLNSAFDYFNQSAMNNTIRVYGVKIKNTVILQIDYVGANTTQTSTPLVQIPAKYRPAITQSRIAALFNAGTQIAMAWQSVISNGNIEVNQILTNCYANTFMIYQVE